MVFANGTINFLNVDGSHVVFSIDTPKAHEVPTCVAEEHQQQYAVSLESENGRAIYSLLITAMSSSQSISIESSGACLAGVAFEQASSVYLTPAAKSEASSKVQWVGYSKLVAGNFAVQQNKGLYLAGTEICNMEYPGSRMMLWNDYVQIINEYPHSETVWFIDAAEQIEREGKNMRVLFKSGEVLLKSMKGFSF